LKEEVKTTTNYHSRPLTFFASLRPQLDRYFEEVVKLESGTTEHELSVEAGERLAQIDFLYQRVVELQNASHEVSNQLLAVIDKNGGKYTDAEDRFTSILKEGTFQIRLHGEAFYYFAARFIAILKRYPAFKNLDVAGIRNVRNHLIEHSDKPASGITQQNWSHGSGIGPMFKSSRRKDQKPIPMDRGLFANATELRDKIERKLNPILDSIPLDTRAQP
jgi:hypothetical protein